MSFTWKRENPAHWDEGKARAVGAAPPGALALGEYREGDVLPGEWWRVERDGSAIGYGWMDTTWGDAEILLAVAPAEQGRGAGTFILEQLEKEAAKHGLNYLHNVVREEHPERERVTRWLEARGFHDSGDGRLKRRVHG